MDVNTLDNVRGAVHILSLVLFLLVAVVGFVGAVKPLFLKKIFKEFSERKYIVTAAIFVCLLCASVFTATESLKAPYQSNQGPTNTSGQLEKPDRQVSGADTISSGSSNVKDPDAPIGASEDTNVGSDETLRQTVPAQAAQQPSQPQTQQSTPSTSQPSQTQAEPKQCTISLLGGRICL